MNIELFPCSGGMSLGFRRAGIEFDMAIDYDTDACDSHEKNLGLRPIRMDVRDFLRMVRLGWRPPNGVNLLVADPPCTPWSRAGKRQGLDDERDLLRETAELITLLRPAFYLIGNVPGLQDSNHWGVVQEVIGGLATHGYCVADNVQLDAANYGVPQHRIRPFWYGHRIGTPCIHWPAPTHGAPSATAHLPGVDALAPWVTCRAALANLPLGELGRSVRIRLREASDGAGSDRSRCSRPDEAARTIVAREARKGGQILIPSKKHPHLSPDGLASTIRGGGDGHSAPHVVLANDRHPPASPASPAPTIGAKDRGQSTVMLLDNPNQPARSPDEVMATITAGGRGHTARLEWPWEVPSDNEGPNAIVLSERAAAILQGFPDGWFFSGETKKARWSQLGQAMPPPFSVCDRARRCRCNGSGKDRGGVVR